MLFHFGDGDLLGTVSGSESYTHAELNIFTRGTDQQTD